MDWTRRIFPEHELIAARFTGTMVARDFEAWVEETRKTPRYQPHYDGIVDLRDVEMSVERPHEAQRVAEHVVSERVTRGRWAILIRRPLESALVMLYGATVTKQHPLEAFSTVEGAAAFLGRRTSLLRQLLTTLHE